MAGRANKRFAILVYGLPAECEQEAFALLPSKAVVTVTHDAQLGLGIYYEDYGSVKECLRQQSVRMRGNTYNIYPLVTNLTLHDIRRYASESTMRNLVAPYGPVMDLYPVLDVTNDGKYETTSLTDDYRVVLDVPEVQVAFGLCPLRLPGVEDRIFRVSFFCRGCRQNDHLQYQCPDYTHRAVFRDQPARLYGQRPADEKSFYEAGASSTPSADRPWCSRIQPEIPKETKPRIKREPNTEAEEYNSSKCSISRHTIKFDETDAIILKGCDKPERIPLSPPFDALPSGDKIFDRYYVREENIYCSDPVKMKSRDVFQQHSISNESLERYPTSGDELASGKAVRTHTATEEKRRSQSTEQTDGDLPRKMPRKGVVWRRLIPKHHHFETAKELLRDVVHEKRSAEDISAADRRQLREMLDWSRGVRRLGKMERKFIRWLQLFLAKTERSAARQQEDVAGGQPIAETVKAEISNRKKSVNLSPCIERIVLKTPGELPPRFLRNFLLQIRGRKNQLEIASHFTKDIPALLEQLERVVENYYLYGERGNAEDRDISFIKRMRSRLLEKYGSEGGIRPKRAEIHSTCHPNYGTSFPDQSISNEKCDIEMRSDIESKESYEMDQPCHSTEKSVSSIHRSMSSDSHFARKSGLNDRSTIADSYFTEFVKLPSIDGHYSRTSISTLQGKGRKENTVSAFEKNSFHVRRLKNAIPARQSRTEEKSVGDVQENVRQSLNFPSEGQVRRISGGNKLLSNREDDRVKCQPNSRKSPIPTKANGKRPITVEDDYICESNWDLEACRLSAKTSDTVGMLSSSDENTFENFQMDPRRNLPTNLQSIQELPITDEILPEISKSDLLKILTLVRQSSAPQEELVETETSHDTDSEYSRRILE